ncbi:hypothetical protein C7T94_12550 [Pedobacter yulinensis]|uniref:Macroglobulin domain-containing protein n=1 Tax=Pedobacter yulinensis TaxID=2126353 RepID=A0A2T3HLT4_9SPHI|nr:carboxypeptidase-like regulatory domain-containing protein [Pedobacter yulinensis]PST83397.1 hypothetical protein C7T94_12550 [Pedobacter yulinensis]
MSRSCAILLTFVLFSLQVAAQSGARQEVNTLIDSLQAHTRRTAPERLYIHTDRDGYLAADTIWFKAYLFNGSLLGPSEQSRIMYVELISDSNAVVARQMIPVAYGLAGGTIVLPDKLTQGTYLLRGYTNWMRNQGTAHFFSKELFIGTPAAGDWLLHYKPRFASAPGARQVRLDLRFRQLDETLVGLREMKLAVSQGKKNLVRTNTETGLDGDAYVDFELPESNVKPDLVLSVQDRRKTGNQQTIRLPLIFNRAEHRDIQFLPEGGNLVAGLPVLVAFKSLHEDGTGAHVGGQVINQEGKTIVEFVSEHLGMGAFRFTPEPGSTYKARIILPGGGSKDYPLPAVKPSGIILSVFNDLANDSCLVRVLAAGTATPTGQRYFLVGHSRGIVAFAAAIGLSQSFATLKISKKAFPSGVARITLLDANRQPLAERAFYVDHQDALRVKIVPSKTQYALRDSVNLTLQVTDAGGKPVRGSFSLSVTANSQVRSDSLRNDNMTRSVLLHAELKGNVEQPAYYEGAAGSPRKWRHLDLLLLTQAWVKFDIAAAFRPPAVPAYAAEKEFVVSGTVTNAFNKPVPGAPLALFSKKPVTVLDTVADARGRFMFTGLVPVDTAIYFIQAKNRRGKSFNVGLEVDIIPPPALPAPVLRRLPWFANIDTASLVKSQQQVALRREQESATGIRLQEVIIRGKKLVPDSKNVNGPGAADVIFDEADMIKAGRTTLGDLLRSQLKNFGERTSKTGERFHTVNFVPMHLIIDGKDVDFFLPPGTPRYEYFRQLLDYFSAEEIKGIEVMYSGKYQMGYTSRYLHPMAVFYEHSFVEVTTRSGHGPMMRKSIGTLVHRPLPFTLPKTFYTPRYRPGAKADGSDMRATIHWEPNLTTDSAGIARIGFFTADKAGTYVINVQGTDLAGSLGFGRADLHVRRTNANEPEAATGL